MLKAKETLCTDPYVTRRPVRAARRGARRAADLLVIAAPHPEYRDLTTDMPVVDMWGITGQGVRV